MAELILSICSLGKEPFDLPALESDTVAATGPEWFGVTPRQRFGLVRSHVESRIFAWRNHFEISNRGGTQQSEKG